METTVDTSELLPAVADRLRAHMPQLAGRALAVSEADATKDNVPTLPIAIVAPLVQNFTHNGEYRMTVNEEFVIEVWMPPEREKTIEGGETPFWSYYAYNAFRDQLFDLFAAWRTPQNGTVRFVSMGVESNFLATVLTFRLRATYDICSDNQDVEAPAQITLSLCAPATKICEPPCEEQEKC